MEFKINSDGVFITESKESIFISVGTKNYKIKYSEELNKRLRDSISEIRKTGTSLDEVILDYLKKIQVAVPLERKILKKFEVNIRNRHISKIMKRIIAAEKNKYRIDISETSSVYCGLLPNRSGILIGKNKNFIEEICGKNSNTSKEFAEYLLAVLDKCYTENLEEKLNKSEILCISLKKYVNDVQCYSKEEIADFFRSEYISEINYNFEKLYPLIIAEYRNIYGMNFIVIGEDKDDCNRNIEEKLMNMNIYSKYLVKKGSSEVKLTELEKYILSFYFPKYNVTISGENNDKIYNVNGESLKVKSFSLLIEELIDREKLNL